jgi:2,3-bisphosphoglycerate-independent phosphoglycerate mutase
VLIPSKNIARHDDSPEMMAKQVTTRVLSALGEGVYDFILVNYANADVIAHTGNFEAATVAIQTVDAQVEAIMKVILESGGIMVITADHGNVEEMLDLQTGIPETTHDPNPVPIYVVTKGYERQKTDAMVKNIDRSNVGVLSDVAPTVLELMGVPKPAEMNGISLLQSLR